MHLANFNLKYGIPQPTFFSYAPVNDEIKLEISGAG